MQKKPIISPCQRYVQTSGLIILILLLLLAVPITGDSPETIFSTMTTEERVGQVFMPAISPSGSNGTTEMTEELETMFDTIHPGGVILFSRDINAIDQLVTLTDELQKKGAFESGGTQYPLFISIDQEGGLIGRLPFGPRMPGTMALGAAGSVELTRSVAREIGRELASLGITMNFAPVLDVETNQDNPVIGVRSFGGDPTMVAEHGVAYIRGMQEAGIICSGKHFPGHGDVDVDSHFSLPVENHDRDRMNEVELVPFRSAIQSGVDSIMTAHIIFPAYDDTITPLPDGQEMPTPATLSRPILTGLLREELGFNGLIITDAMMMKAISDNFGTGDAAVMAVRAGADIILMPEPPEEAFAAVLAAYQTDPEVRERVNESVIRILTLKEQQLSSFEEHMDTDLATRIATAESVCLGEEIYALEQTAADKAVTLVQDRDNNIPISLSEEENIVVFSPTDPFSDEFIRAFDEVPVSDLTRPDVITYTDQNNLTDEQKQAVSAASYVILGTFSSNAGHRGEEYYIPRFSQDLIRYAADEGVTVIGISLGQPYDIMYMQDIPVYLASYAGRTGGQNLMAAVRAITGEIPIQGTLPVSIDDAAGDLLYPIGYGLKR